MENSLEYKRNMFDDKINSEIHLCDKDDLEKIFESKSPRNGCGRAEKYKRIIFFKTWKFKSPRRHKQTGEILSGVNVMPYRIYRSDVEEAQEYSSHDLETFPDFDSTSGNIHKKAEKEIDLQIVLRQQGKGGPGLSLEGIKTNYYFPNIDEPDKQFNLREIVREILEFTEEI